MTKAMENNEDYNLQLKNSRTIIFKNTQFGQDFFLCVLTTPKYLNHSLISALKNQIVNFSNTSLPVKDKNFKSLPLSSIADNNPPIKNYCFKSLPILLRNAYGYYVKYFGETEKLKKLFIKTLDTFYPPEIFMGLKANGFKNDLVNNLFFGDTEGLNPFQDRDIQNTDFQNVVVQYLKNKLTAKEIADSFIHIRGILSNSSSSEEFNIQRNKAEQKILAVFALTTPTHKKFVL